MTPARLRHAARAVPFLVAAGLAVRPARAAGPVGVEIAAVVGGGTNPSYAPTILGFGAGGRAGVSFCGVYLGAAATDYAGGSATLAVSDAGVHDRAHTFLAGGDAGYTVPLGVLRVRPLVELGVAELTEAGGTRPAFYLQPGFTVLVPLGPLFVGVDLNGLILPSDARPCFAGCTAPKSTLVALTVHGQVGVRF